MEKRTVYILFTRSGTWFSRVIRIFTGGDYTHVSIGLNAPSGPYYSFARKYPRRPFPGGLVKERPGAGFFGLHPDTLCALYALEVDAAAYAAIARKVEAMLGCQEEYHYNLLGAVSCYFRLPLKRRRHYFCSQFVAEALTEAGAVELDMPSALTRPMDLCRLSSLRSVLRGRVGALAG